MNNGFKKELAKCILESRRLLEYIAIERCNRSAPNLFRLNGNGFTPNSALGQKPDSAKKTLNIPIEEVTPSGIERIKETSDSMIDTR